MCEVKSPDNQQNLEFVTFYCLIIYLVKTDKISSSVNELHDLKACDKTIFRLCYGYFLFL